jgi:hypothetical protein
MRSVAGSDPIGAFGTQDWKASRLRPGLFSVRRANTTLGTDLSLAVGEGLMMKLNRG